MKVSLDGHDQEGQVKPRNVHLHAQLAYIRDHLHYGTVFAHYGIEWKSNETHQLSCPFHGVDANPSARYYDTDNRIWCFACNEGGDVAWFVKKQEGLETWREVVEFISQEFGVGLTAADLTKRIELETKQRTQFQAGKRRILSDTYSNRVNDKIHRVKQLGEGVASAVDAIIPGIFRKLDELNGKDCSYMQFTQLIRHWANWSISSIDQAVKNVADSSR